MGIFSSKKGLFSACVSRQGKYYTCVISRRRHGDAYDVIYANVLEKDDVRELFVPLLHKNRSKTQLTLALDPADYRFIVIDKPKVKERKLYKSVRWEIANYLDDDPKLFEYQIYLPSRQPDKVIVFLLEKTVLAQYRKFAKDVLKMPLERVTIPELALSQLIKTLAAEEDNTLAWVQQYPDFLMLLFLADECLQAIYMLPHFDKQSIENFSNQAEQALINIKKAMDIDIDLIYWNVDSEIFDLVDQVSSLKKYNHRHFELQLSEVLVEQAQLPLLAPAVGGTY